MGTLFQIARKITPKPIKRFVWNILQHTRKNKHIKALEKHRENPEVIRIATKVGGGLGDYIVYLALIDKIQSLACCTIDVYTHFSQPLFDNRANVYEYPYSMYRFKQYTYDLSITFDHHLVIDECNTERVRAKAPLLYAAVLKIEAINKEHLPMVTRLEEHVTYHSSVLFYVERKELNRYTQLSYDGLFNLSEQRASLFTNMYRYQCLDRVGLSGKQYITVNRGADEHSGGSRQTKIWPKNRYEEFISLFKQEYPEILVVQLKTNSEEELSCVDKIIDGADLEDVMVVLKNAEVYVGSEGGLAHVASNLSTPCVVVFGPTPEFYYGYARNVNVVSPTCRWCMAAIKDWYTKCLHGFAVPPCMMDITGEMVLAGVDKIFQSCKAYSYKVENISCYTSAALKEYAPVIQNIVAKNGMTDSERNSHIFGPCRTYIHSSKRWEYPYILEQLNREGAGLKVADVGAGRGALSLYLARNGHNMTVCDMDFNWDNGGDPMMHNKFIMYCRENSVNAEVATGFNIPKDDDTFDVVISTSVIEHVLYKEYMLKEMLRVLKPGGILIMTYDLMSISSSTDAAARVEVASPDVLRKLLSHIAIDVELYSKAEIKASLSDIRADHIAETMSDGITVGGMVIRKLSSLKISSAFGV
ncbi:hypothetical protein FACS1894202_07620 [Clostridia bacterium]|nr:hypothetical protein FACS1894202_07620 [Clostridia bacterium]